MRSLGLYIHIPFCRAKCIYCDFYSLPRAEEKMDAYCAALLAQFTAWRERCAQHCVDTVYFGGGTPSYLGEERLSGLLAGIFENFTLAPDAEITLEANPDSAQDAAALRSLRSGGFNRISLGMQSADDGELKRIGRIHTHAQTMRAVAAAREAGFDNVSLDLIYGLPEQTAGRWMENLRAAVSLAPEHLSCYGLKVEPGTPLAAMDLALPDDDAQAEAYLAAVDYLAKEGYGQYEISSFCRAGRESRHNARYWALAEYLGLGCGAHSDFGGERFAVARDLGSFLRGELRYSERTRIDEKERERERVMLSLRTARGLDASALGGEAEALFSKLARHGLCRKEGEIWALTPRGFLVSNAIIAEVLELLS